MTTRGSYDEKDHRLTLSRSLLSMLLLGALTACDKSEPVTQIIISVATDYQVPDKLDAVSFRIERQNGKAYDPPRYERTEMLAGASPPTLPLTLAMTSLDGGKPTVRVTVAGYVDNQLRVERQAIVSFRSGQTLSLPMNLVRLCEGKVCEPDVTTCGDDGQCEPIARDDLKAWTGMAPDVPSSGGDMDSGGSSAGMSEAGMSEAGIPDAETSDAGMTDAAVPDSAVPAQAAVISLSVGFHHSCAVMRSGRVYCWGGNRALTLGSVTPLSDCPDTSFACSPDARLVPNVEDAIQVGSGEAFSCALTRAGNVWCWGSNDNGQIGAAGNSAPSPPSQVRFQVSPTEASTLLSGIDALAVGRMHACARVASTKGLVCWGGGTNQFSQIPRTGPGTSMAVQTDITSGVERFALGHYHGCFIDISGGLSCWGWNASGQVGIDPTIAQTRLTPHQVFDGKVTEVALSDTHTCAIRDGLIRCFGLAEFGALGIGPVPAYPDCYSGPCTPTPQTVNATVAGQPTGLALGGFASCARYANGRMACWGTNEDGQGGQVGTNRIYAPIEVPNPRGVRLMAAFGAHVCITTDKDQIFCWGANDEGQLGPNAVFGQSTPELSEITIVDP